METNVNEKSFLDSIVDALPVEVHLGNFEFLGPGTKLTERLASHQTGINPLDAAALQHDLAYARNENRRLADEKLINVAFARLVAENSDNVERSAALLTACCLVSKISVEKFFSRVKRACTRLRSTREAKKHAYALATEKKKTRSTKKKPARGRSA